MKSSKKHIDQKIKKKVEKYEFDFSDHAWDKMETLMDRPPPPTRSNHLFTFRKFTIMILLLILLYFGANYIVPEDIKLSDNNPIPTTELPATIQETKSDEEWAKIPNELPTTATSDATTTIHKTTTKVRSKKAGPKTKNQIVKAEENLANSKSIQSIVNPVQQNVEPNIAPPILEDTSLVTLTSTLVDTIAEDVFFQRLSQQLKAYEDHYHPEKVYLHFDRLFFRPGETIWFNAYLRDANTLKASGRSEVVYIELKSPNGSILKTVKLIAKQGHVFGDFQLAADAVGGSYTVKAYTNWQKNQKTFFERKIQIQNAVLPRLKMELDFVRKAYGPGDQVEAKLDLKGLDNQPLSKKRFGYAILLEGQVLKSDESKTDRTGKTTIRFALPKDLATNDGLLNVVIDYQGQNESIARSIPIVLNKIDLQFLPEGGEMVSGFPTRMAFKALNEFGKPADIEGQLFNSKGESVVKFRSYHQGMGAFTFEPQAGEHYYAQITRPEKIVEDYYLPKAMPRGYSLQLGVVQEDELQVDIHSSEAEDLHLVLHTRGQIYETKTLSAHPGSQTVKLSTADIPIGIAQLTLFDSKEIPRAERLVFLHPEKRLNINITTDKERYRPREEVKLSVEVKDERGIPMPGQFSLAVANDNLLTFADDKQGNILSYLLLESDLRGEVRAPNFYFDLAEKHPDKDQLLALDYLMLTQGWRRFGWEQMEQKDFIAMQFPAERAVISGVVLDDKRDPIVNAKLEVLGTDHVVMTNEEGQFVFENVVLYDHKVKIRMSKEKLRRSFVVNGYEEGREIQFSSNTSSTVLLKDIRGAGNQTIRGNVKTTTGEELIGATVLIKGTSTGTMTDLDGNFEISQLPEKNVELQISYVGFGTEIVNFEQGVDEDDIVDIVLEESVQLNEVVVIEYKVPLIEKDNTTSGAVITSEAIKRLPTKNISALASRVSGVSASDEGDGLTIRGSRSEATTYYLDGIRVSSSDLDLAKLEEEKTRREFGEARTLRDVKNKDLNPYRGGKFKSQIQERMDQQKYAMNFRRGFYRSREFYVPNYREKEVNPVLRNDFRPTIYWNPSVNVGRDGTAEMSFFTCDEMTTFRATIEGLGKDGSIGQTEHRFYSQLPIGIDLKLPERVLSGDVLTIPMTLSNHLEEAIKGELKLTIPQEFVLQQQIERHQNLAAGESKTIYLSFLAHSAAEVEGLFDIQFVANGSKDAVRQSVKIIPRGFPVEEFFSGDQQEQTYELQLNNPIEGTVSANLKAYPSLADDLVGGMERMLRQPNGCFEQTSSSNYPNVLVLDYLESTNNLDKSIEKKTRKFLNKGYNRLLGFEVNGGGFDWYGKAPANEVLTAYGLLQFVDMSEVFAVDQRMIKRNAKWLLSRRDGKGGWKRNARGSSRWKGGDAISDAYVVWALAEADMADEIDQEIEKSYTDAMNSKDPYLLALLANTLYAIEDDRADQLMDVLLPLQQADGSWLGLSHSVMRSYGKGFAIETTALTVLAMLKEKVGIDRLEKAMRFIKGSKSKYGFGSTQSTVLAMKALVANAKHFYKSWKGGHLTLYINGEKVAKEKYKSNSRAPITFTHLEQHLKVGANQVQVQFSKEEAILPYEIRLQYNTRQPNNSSNCLIELNTALSAEKTKMGDNLRLTTRIRNTTDEAIPNTIAKVGIPAGLSVQAWQLKELQEKEVFDFYELFDGYIVFHYRGLDRGEEKVIHLDLKADIPGTYEAPASVAYLYYTNEDQVWAKPGRVVVEY